MLIQIKNILIIIALSSSLAACSATTQTTGGMSGMKMNPAMCKEMMAKKGCDCCKMMQGQEDMRTSGMMTGGVKPMMCMPKEQEENKAPVKEAAPEVSPKDNEAEHKAHHPNKAQ